MGIVDLLTIVGETFNNDSILMSRHLLRLFELWANMDEAATSMCLLIKEYHPLFIPDALYVLCSMTRDEIKRLLRVQQYIRNRVASHKKGSGTIFDAPLQIRGRIRRQIYERVCFNSDLTVLSQVAQTDHFVPIRDRKSSVKSC